MAMTQTSPAPPPVPAQAALPATAPPLPPLTSGAAGADHKLVGTLYVGFALLFLVVGGVIGMVLRAQLASPDADLLAEREFRQLFTYHGVFLVFLFLLPAWIGLATAIVPLQIGATRQAFPRLHAFCLWTTVAGAALMVSFPLMGGGSRVVSGWTLLDPIPVGEEFSGRGVDYLVVGLGLVLVAAVLASAGLIATIARMRAPGLRLRQIPLFSWSSLVSSAVLILALPVLLAALVILYVDREFGGLILSGFTSDGGGNPGLWPRLVWFAVYPTVWALLLPALGAISEIVPVFARHRVAKRAVAMAALGAVGVLAFAGWGSEVPELRPARLMFVLGALAVLAPVASLILNWLMTIREGRSAAASGGGDAPDLGAAPMVLASGAVAVLGLALAASAVSALDATGDLHTNAWATGQHHALLAASTVAVAAALHFWAPKLWGFRLSGKLSRLEVLLLAGGALLMSVSELALGLSDMPVHVSTYSSGDGWELGNLGAAVGGVAVALGVVVVIANLLTGFASRARYPQQSDPWGGHTLEWVAASPPPPHNFDALPTVRSDTPVLDRRETLALPAAEDGS